MENNQEAEKCQKEIDAILEKYGFEYTFDMSFPQYNPIMLPNRIKLLGQLLLEENVLVTHVLKKKATK